jgi:hypothetical protein
MRFVLSLSLGILVGGVGATLFIQSMPPPVGSAEERAGKLEAELKHANNRLAVYESKDPRGHQARKTLADGARLIAENIRDGKPVSPDDLFRATQPLIRDLSPLLDRIRVKELQRQTDEKVGELTRKYSLNPAQQEALTKWLNQNAEDAAKRYTNLLTQEGTRVDDIGKASAEFRADDGLATFMERTLAGDKLKEFRSDHMLEKVSKVQEEADMKVTRLDSIVHLDDSQRGAAFAVMARGARDFDPAMQFEGLGVERGGLATGQSRQDAILAMLKPEQQKAYRAEQEKRRATAQREMESIGLTLPADWHASDLLDF